MKPFTGLIGIDLLFEDNKATGQRKSVSELECFVRVIYGAETENKQLGSSFFEFVILSIC